MVYLVSFVFEISSKNVCTDISSEISYMGKIVDGMPKNSYLESLFGPHVYMPTFPF